MLSSLIAISALIQFAFITRLSLLRRIITPTVAGTVLMLMSATIISVVLGRLPDIPEDAPMIAAPILAGATLLVLVGMRLFALSRLQQWAPIIGISAGCAAAVAWGLFDFERVLAGAVGGCAGKRVAGLRSELQCYILVAAARIRDSGNGNNDKLYQ